MQGRNSLRNASAESQGMGTHKKRPLLRMMLIVWGLVPCDEPSPRVLLER